MIPPITADSMARDYGVWAARVDPTGDVSAKSIIRRVALKHNVTTADITGPRKFTHLVAARDEAIADIHKSLNMTAAQIGRIFNRDHSTVKHSLRKAGL